MTKIYHYDQEGVYVETSEARVVQEQVIVPASATTIKPPKPKKGYACVFDSEKQAWEQIADHRGKTAWGRDSANDVEIDFLGDLPDTMTFLQPPEFPAWNETTQSWDVDTEWQLAITKEKAIAQARQEYTKAIKTIKDASPSEEVGTWSQQALEANAFVADSEATTPLLNSLVVSRSKGETKQELAEKIINHHKAYGSVVGEALGKMQSQIKAIDAATSLDDLDSLLVSGSDGEGG